MPKYNVKIDFSVKGTIHGIRAESEEEAIEKAWGRMDAHGSNLTIIRIATASEQGSISVTDGIIGGLALQPECAKSFKTIVERTKARARKGNK